MVTSISPLKEKILRALARYKYLTVSQMKGLGLSKNLESLRSEMRKLKERKITGKLVNTSVSESLMQKGITRQIRREDLHYLTPKGATFLDEETELHLSDIRYPKRIKLRLSNDYFHRVSCINMHISLVKWLERMDFTEIDTLLYYDKRGKFKIKDKIESRVKRRNGETKTPDVVFAFNKPSGDVQAFILEVYNGARKGYVHDETVHLFETLQETTALSDRMGIDKLPRVLITCDTRVRMERAMERIKKDSYFDFENIDELLLFNIDSLVWKDFGTGWHTLNGHIVNLQDFSTAS